MPKRGDEQPGSRKEICFPYLKNNVCRYGDDCYRLHVPNLDARSDVRRNVKTPITDEIRQKAKQMLAEPRSTDGARASTATSRNADFTAPTTVYGPGGLECDVCYMITPADDAACMMMLPPEPEFADAVMAHETTVADNTAPYSPTTADVRVGNVKCRALIDTGSRVNLISRVLYNCILADQDLSPGAMPAPLEAVGGSLHGAGAEQLRLLGRVKLRLALSEGTTFTATTCSAPINST